MLQSMRGRGLVGLVCMLAASSHALAGTTVFSETWNPATAGVLSSGPLAADNNWTVANGANVGTVRITDLGSGEKVYEHITAGSGGSAPVTDSVLTYTVPGANQVNLSNGGLRFQFEVTQPLASPGSNGNRHTGILVKAATGSKDGFAVRFANRSDNCRLEWGSVNNDAAPSYIATPISGPAAIAAKKLRVTVSIIPGSTDTKVNYQVANLTDANAFIAAGTQQLAFLPDANTIVDLAQVFARQNTLAQMDNHSVFFDVAPSITLNGSSSLVVVTGDPYVELGATATDTEDGNLTGSIVTSGTVNTAVPGTYPLNYEITDSFGNKRSVSRSVVVSTRPVISLLGTSPITVPLGSVYADAGATATDAEDGNLTGSIATVNPVNTSTVGTYTVTYNVSDSSGLAATQVARTVDVTDQTAPNAVTITPGTTGPTNASTVSFTVDFDEAVQDFNNASDVVIAHTGTANTGVSISGGPQNYTVDITGISGNGTFTLAISTSSDVADLAANALASSVTSAAVSIDTLAPTPSLNSTAPATVGGAFTVEVSTGEPTTDFDGSDLTVSNGAISDFAGSGDTYSFTLTPSASPVSVQINAARYVDAAGNSNLASSVLSRTFDATLPTVVSIVPVSPISGPTNVDSIVFTVTFDEAVQNVNDGTDFVVGTTGSVNTGTATVSTVSATEYTATVPGITGDGTLTLQANTASDIRDLSNNPLSASIVSAVITLDNTNPSVLLTSLAPNPTNGPFSVSVSLGESVTTFGSASVSLTNATLSNFAGSGDAYSFTLTAVADGPVSAVVSDLEFSDTAGNPNDASNVFNIVVDTTDPTFTDITAVPSTASAGDEVTITFSTTDTIAGDPEVTVNGNLATRAAKAAFTYTYTVGANDPIGPATIQIDGFDTAGNVGSSSDNTALVIESLEPEVPAANGFTLGIAAVLVALAGAGLLNARTRRDS